MADQDGSARAPCRQPVKLGELMKCDTCETRFPRKSHRHRYCGSCLPIELAKKSLARDKVYRRHAGESCLGEPFDCHSCGLSSPRLSGSQKWCPDCKKQIRRKQVSDSYAKNKRNYRPNDPVVGHPATCSRCDGVFIRTGTFQIMCRGCVPQAKREYSVRFARKTRPEWYAKPANRIQHRMGNHIRECLRENKAGRRWEKIVGYTLADLMRHLESRFAPGMGWHNVRDWHVDHIRPRRLFQFENDTDPQFKECWALSNLQPLWALDNLKKGGRYLVETLVVARQTGVAA
jgi:hypothetical protein